jgi:hypothetical protein
MNNDPTVAAAACLIVPCHGVLARLASSSGKPAFMDASCVLTCDDHPHKSRKTLKD